MYIFETYIFLECTCMIASLILMIKSHLIRIGLTNFKSKIVYSRTSNLIVRVMDKRLELQ